MIGNECNVPINLNDYDVEIVNEFPEEVEKILIERSTILKKALFSSPVEGILPEHYWSMEGNKDEYIRRMRQYNEEMDKVIKAVAPIVATSMKTKFILTPKPPSRAKGNKMEIVETKHDLLTTKYTKVLEEAEYKYNAPHTFIVIKAEEENSEEHKGENLVLAEIHFQEGPIKECGVNGVMNEDLLVMVIRRLEGFQNSEFKCRENACAITKLEEALLWLRKRTMGRENRGVEGTNKV